MRERARERSNGGAASAPERPSSTPTNRPGAGLAIAPTLKVLVFWIAIAALLYQGFAWLDRSRSTEPFPPTGSAQWFVQIHDVPTAPLSVTVEATARDNRVLRLDDWISGSPVVIVPIRVGETANLAVPLGRYRVTTAHGARWLGPDRMFGPSAQVRASTGPLHFFRDGSRVVGHRLRFGVDGEGNLPMRPVDRF